MRVTLIQKALLQYTTRVIQFNIEKRDRKPRTFFATRCLTLRKSLNINSCRHNVSLVVKIDTEHYSRYISAKLLIYLRRFIYARTQGRRSYFYLNNRIFPSLHVVPSIAQLVERRTVEYIIVILRSLVRIRLEGNFFLIELFFFSFLFFFFFRLPSIFVFFLVLRFLFHISTC